MLRSIMGGGDIGQLILFIPVVLLSISFHEYSHGWVADRLGDPTARYEGRLTLNPLKHFNPMGFFMMLIAGFGWATPVPVNPNNFKNPSRGMLYTALAGPVANMILAVVSSLLYVIMYYVAVTVGISSEFALELYNNCALLLSYMMYLNISLAVFNLIPVYPLDGSRILGYFMPVKYHNFMAKYGGFVQITFMLIVILTSAVSNFIGWVQSGVAGALISFWQWVIEGVLRLF